MSKKKWIIAECARALAAARPFVVDGRSDKEAERVLTLVDTALELAQKYRPDAANG
jgi:hypothetical protein